MARETVGGADLAPARAEFNISNTTPGAWVPGLIGVFNAVVGGTFVGTIVIEASFDGGTTAFVVPAEDGGSYTITAPALAQLRQDEPGVLHRLRATAWTSGTANCRLSGGSLGR